MFEKRLEQLCRCSGQRVNYQKSSMFFSLNVASEEAVCLSERMGIPQKKEVGMYLGHQIVLRGEIRSDIKLCCSASIIELQVGRLIVY